MRSFTTAERRARLGRRHGLAGAGFRTPTAASDGLVGLHASDPATPYLSLHARVTRFDPVDLDTALYDERSLSKHLCMRRTLFVVGDAVLPAVHGACSVPVARAERTRLANAVEAAGLTTDGRGWLRRAERATLASLDRLGPATGAQLSRATPEIQAKLRFGEDKSWGGEVGVSTRVLTILAVEGRIRRGRPTRWTGSNHTWERTDGPPDHLAATEATDELVRRWLATFGPGTVDDLVWWTGLGKTKVRHALARVGAVEVDLDGTPGVVAADDLAPARRTKPWVAFLPALDPTVMGWKDRDWYLGPHRPALFDRNGNAGPTVWADGRVVGGWTQRPSGEVRYELLEDPGAEHRSMVERRAHDLEQWLGDVVITPRFPTPLDRRLRA